MPPSGYQYQKIVSRKVFIPLSYDPGSVAQVDWGQALVRLGGKLLIAHMFCAKLMASGRIFVHAFPPERAFFLGLHRFL